VNSPIPDVAPTVDYCQCRLDQAGWSFAYQTELRGQAPALVAGHWTRELDREPP
jgi:hypothetical protein